VMAPPAGCSVAVPGLRPRDVPNSGVAGVKRRFGGGRCGPDAKRRTSAYASVATGSCPGELRPSSAGEGALEPPTEVPPHAIVTGLRRRRTCLPSGVMWRALNAWDGRLAGPVTGCVKITFWQTQKTFVASWFVGNGQ
jgi:hypothetical protein